MFVVKYFEDATVYPSNNDLFLIRMRSLWTWMPT